MGLDLDMDIDMIDMVLHLDDIMLTGSRSYGLTYLNVTRCELRIEKTWLVVC